MTDRKEHNLKNFGFFLIFRIMTVWQLLLTDVIIVDFSELEESRERKFWLTP